LSPEKIWEADKGQPRRVDWLELLEVDETRPRADWHKLVIARNSKRTDQGEELTDPLVQNEKSGCVKAVYNANTFTLTTSRVSKVKLWIHPEMVQLDKPVRVVANGKEVFNKVVNYDSILMMNQFFESFDRRLVWVNAITIDVPK